MFRIRFFRRALFIFSLFSLMSLYAQSEQAKVEWINNNINLATELSSSGRGINSSIIEALKKVPRHIFIDETYSSIAYDNISLPGSYGGFLASPGDTLAAIGMLSPSSSDKILIAGSNTGYPAAILSELAAEIYLIEETPAAGEYKSLFAELGISNIRTSAKSDINAFSDIIAFDKIFICGAVSEVSEKLTERLAIQGNMTFILAEEGGFQQIVSLRRSLLGDSISCGGSCYFPEIKALRITN
ncbi:MAG: hypothetical protein PQJ61_11860 [Spirochaetales bacterium]|uniref:Protein-L-isoaspartate O-methyltransferase n=1 Tax=Candidatus Thalassospirochaeta sargassi TaxID=3119039 RepID=A0AAJ1MPA0_9SPIO|nr:hypothetical protein [Spirochaetales bacterium]